MKSISKFNKKIELSKLMQKKLFKLVFEKIVKEIENKQIRAVLYGKHKVGEKVNGQAELVEVYNQINIRNYKNYVFKRRQNAHNHRDVCKIFVYGGHISLFCCNTNLIVFYCRIS